VVGACLPHEPARDRKTDPAGTGAADDHKESGHVRTRMAEPTRRKLVAKSLCLRGDAVSLG
jgi:hypothetical protein